MGDLLSKVIMTIFGCIMLFFVPLIIISQKNDVIAQNYIDNAVIEFVDSARSVGQITDSSYENLCNKVDSTGILCDVKITHSSSFVVPTKQNEETGYFETEIYTYDYTKDDILNTIYTTDELINNSYKMKAGDYLKVEVENISPSFGTRLVQLIMPKKDDSSIYSVYGGYIGSQKI